FEFEKLGVIAIATAIWGVMGKVADWVGEKSAMGRFIDAWFKTPLRAVLRAMTRPAPLYGTAVVVGAVMATVSSVTVRSSAPGERAVVSLASVDSRGTPRADPRQGRRSVPADPNESVRPHLRGRRGWIRGVPGHGVSPREPTGGARSRS